MVKGLPNFCGKRLTEARVARGLYKNALADMIGVTPMAITRYEAEQDKPPYDRLATIADKLNFPFEFFLRQPWPEKLEPVFWRSQAAETQSAREMTEQRMLWLCELFGLYEQELDFPPLDIPELDVPDDFRLITASMIEQYAMHVRSAWRLRDLPIRNVVLSLENAGIPVVVLDIASEKQDGFFFSSKLLQRPFVGINIHNATGARARFDAAHELGHLLLHRAVTPQQERDKAMHKVLEQQAHRFAGAFLFPRDIFINSVGMPSLDVLSGLKRQWGMSIAAMVNRSYDLDLISKDERTSFFISMSKRKWRGPSREPFDDEISMPIERPRMFSRAVDALLSSGDFTKSTLGALFPLPSSELEQLLGVQRGFLSNSQTISEPVLTRKSRFEAKDLESGRVISFPGRTVR